MDLKLKDVAEMLQVSEKTVYRWVTEKKIPGYRINHQYRFNRDEIKAWILANRIDTPAIKTEEESGVNISECLNRGGIYYKISGDTPAAVIKNAMRLILLPAGLDAQMVTDLLLKREEMMPTAVGNGIAMPHPRTPILSDVAHESVSLCFLNQPIDFGSLDRLPVYVLFIILSANQRRHLEILFKLSHLCRQPEFIALLKREPLRHELLEYIESEGEKWTLQPEKAT